MASMDLADAGNALDYAREQGRLSGEVRVLKWVVGTAFVAILAVHGATYAEMKQGFRDLGQRVDHLTYSMTDVRERLTQVEVRLEGVEGRLGLVEERLDGVEGRLGLVDRRLDRLDTSEEVLGRTS